MNKTFLSETNIIYNDKKTNTLKDRQTERHVDGQLDGEEDGWLAGRTTKNVDWQI